MPLIRSITQRPGKKEFLKILHFEAPHFLVISGDAAFLFLPSKYKEKHENALASGILLGFFKMYFDKGKGGCGGRPHPRLISHRVPVKSVRISPRSISILHLF